ncbi:isoamylase early set domain-containing protein [Fulvivirga maritima]|uniref:isoamylase early set domain-containing protein n=1 Tax=Fulvivirga maritima TaxID=2904247 RepID=UPI001F44ABED|nr:isoamylase early set domain-containing protein [Fulvivirga maritima]UII25654.1 isoamylase early set domain-containing protein [Fulvivirga maritima]
MSIKKQYLKSKPICKVTFAIDKKVANGASTVHLSGNFNDWAKEEDELTALKNGTFKITKELPADQEYEFRYLLDGEYWANDDDADKFIDNGVSNEQNCVIVI